MTLQLISHSLLKTKLIEVEVKPDPLAQGRYNKEFQLVELLLLFQHLREWLQQRNEGTAIREGALETHMKRSRASSTGRSEYTSLYMAVESKSFVHPAQKTQRRPNSLETFAIDFINRLGLRKGMLKETVFHQQERRTIIRKVSLLNIPPKANIERFLSSRSRLNKVEELSRHTSW